MKRYTSSETIISLFALLAVLTAGTLAQITNAAFAISTASADAGPDITVYAGEPVRLDGTASSGYSRESLADGSWSMRWTTGDGYDIENILKAPHVYMRPGTYTAHLSLRDASGATSVDNVTVNVLPIAADAAEVRTVPDAGDPDINRQNLQAALDAAALNTEQRRKT